MIKPIAIYLPQFHPIPENDKAWGEGFTEWTNVKKAKPLFDGHYQPHVPHEDVGYYDLRYPEVMVRQAAMAQEYGIYGFAFYHYWFNGKRLLETPLDNMLKSGKPDFPFLYIWANENWTKRWDGLDNEIIIKQDYSHEDDIHHIRFLCEKVFSDKRYITIDDKPVFMVYRTELLPNIKETAQIWREEARSFGFKDLYLVRVENFRNDINPLEIGFDASMEFAPDSRSIDNNQSNMIDDKGNTAHDLQSTIVNMALKPDRNYPWFRCVSPGWDNSARKSVGSTIHINNSPYLFQMSLYNASQYTIRKFNSNSQFVFINAWNEWGEGCHIEPDVKDGYTYLEVISDVLNEKNLIEYVRFIENILRIKISKHVELENIRKAYVKITSSNGHKLMESVLKKYRKIKRLLHA